MQRIALIGATVTLACGRLSKSEPSPTPSASSSAAAPAPLGSGIRITSQDATHYEVDDDLLALLVVSIAAGAAEAKHTGAGYELSNVQPGSLMARLGFASGDVVVAVGTVTLQTPQALDRAYAEHRDARDVDIKVQRGGKEVVLSYRLRPRISRLTTRRERPLPAARRSGLSADLSKQLDEGITKVDDTHFEVSSALVEELRKDEQGLVGSVRLMPSVRDGKRDGVRLYALRARGLLNAFGFQSRDVVHSIAGREIVGSESMLEIGAKLKDKKQFDVVVTRRGKKLTLHYRIVEPSTK